MSVEVISLRAPTADALNMVANHDIKAMSYVGLVEHGESTTSALASKVAEDSGILACRSLVQTYPQTFHDGGFASITYGTGANGRPARFFEAMQSHEALPVIGAVGIWSEAYEIPIVEALSMTASKGSRAPENAIQILDGLLKGIEIGKMELPGYRLSNEGWSTAHNTRLKRMVEQGYLVAEDVPILVEILDPTYKGQKPFDQLKPATQAGYQILAAAQKISPKPWNLDHLISLAQERAIGANVPASDLRVALVRMISSKTPAYAPGAVQKQEIQHRQYTIAEDFVEPAAALIESIAKVNEGTTTYAIIAADYARDAYRTPSVLSRIIGRGIASSPYIK